MTTTDTKPITVEALDQARAALAAAEARATDTEAQRIRAEASHAEVCAECMMAGKPMPAKPRALSDLQAADDAADAALDILRARHKELEALYRNQEGMAADTAVADLRERKAEAIIEAGRLLAAAYLALSRVEGDSNACLSHVHRGDFGPIRDDEARAKWDAEYTELARRGDAVAWQVPLNDSVWPLIVTKLAAAHLAKYAAH